MNGRTRTWLTLSLLLNAFAPASFAGEAPRDAAAIKLADDAINNDYLATNFAQAEAKLRKARASCGTSGCSAGVRARLHRDLGVVLIAGLGQADEGKNEFVEALKADPKIALEKDLITPEVAQAFQAAGGAIPATSSVAPAETPSSPKPASAVPSAEAAPAEQAILTPIPIYAELQEPAIVKVIARYKAFGASEWKSLELHKMANGFGAEVPCLDVGSATGAFSYYVQATDAAGDVIATLGTRNAPNKVEVKTELSGAPPHLPGKPPPAQCRDVADCPPGLPGCPGKKAGGKGWGASCDHDGECTSGLICKSGSCESSPASGESTGKACETSSDCEGWETCNADKVCESNSKAHKFWLSLNVQQDVDFVPSQLNVCGNASTLPPDQMACLANDGKTYIGVPESGGGGHGNGIKGGPKASTTRILVGVDYLLADNVTIGARVGAAVNAYASPSLHGEGRVAYWFGHSPFHRKGLRPFIAAIGGAAQMDTKFQVPILETLSENTANGIIRPGQTLTVWRKGGTFFAGASVGTMIPIGENQGILAELKFEVLFPNSAIALSPTVGYAFGF